MSDDSSVQEEKNGDPGPAAAQSAEPPVLRNALELVTTGAGMTGLILAATAKHCEVDTERMVYGYVSKTTNDQLRSLRNRAPQKQICYVADGEIPHNIQLTNIGPDDPNFMPGRSPYRVFRIPASKIDYNNGTFNCKDAQLLTSELLSSFQDLEGFVKLLPVCRGVICNDNGVIKIGVYELAVNNSTKKKRWVKNETLLDISSISKSLIEYHVINCLYEGCEVQFRLANDKDGKPFAMKVQPCHLLNSSNKVKPFDYQVEPLRRYSSRSQTTIDTRATECYTELQTHTSTSVQRMLSEILNREDIKAEANRVIHFSPDPLPSDVNGRSPLYFTAGDVQVLLRNKGDTRTKWYQLSCDDLTTMFFCSRTAAELKGILSEDEAKAFSPGGQQPNSANGASISKITCKSHWVFHLYDGPSTTIVHQYIMRAFNASSSHSRTLVANAIVLAPTVDSGPLSAISQQTKCPNLAASYSSPYGVMVNLRARDFSTLSHKDLGPVNLRLQLHIFNDQGHTSPTRIVTTGQRISWEKGHSLMYTATFLPSNVGVKTALQELANPKDKLISILYPNQNPESADPKGLIFGKYRMAVVTVLKGGRENILQKLRNKGAMVAPYSPTRDESERSFQLDSHSWLPFPTEIEALVQNFKYVRMTNRGRFTVYLHDHQTFEEVYAKLDIQTATEAGSDCITASNRSPWSHISVRGKSVLINADYEANIRRAECTVYITGPDTVYGAEWVQAFLNYFTGESDHYKVVDDIELTKHQPGAITARFLHNIDDEVNINRNMEITLSVSTEDPVTLATLTSVTFQQHLQSMSEHKYRVTEKDLHKLRELTKVLSVEEEEKIHQKNVLDHEEELVGDFVPVSGRHNKTLKSTSTKQKESSASRPPSQALGAGRYSALYGQEDEEPNPEEKGPRQADDGDFDKHKDTLVTQWLQQNIFDGTKWDIPTFTKDQKEELRDVSITLISATSPLYHKQSSLTKGASWWTASGKSKTGAKTPGAGYLIISYLKSIPGKKNEGNPATLLQILKEAVSPVNFKQRQKFLQTNIQAHIDQLLIQRKNQGKEEGPQPSESPLTERSSLLATDDARQPVRSTKRPRGDAERTLETFWSSGTATLQSEALEGDLDHDMAAGSPKEAVLNTSPDSLTVGGESQVLAGSPSQISEND
jgi:hypothetical protein